MEKTIANHLKSQQISQELVDNVVAFITTHLICPPASLDTSIYPDEAYDNILKSDYSSIRSYLGDFVREIINPFDNANSIRIATEVLSSFDELRIANFLYINGIDYEYRPLFSPRVEFNKIPYIPDFLLKQGEKRLYLEHVGICEDGTSSLYSNEELRNCKKMIFDRLIMSKQRRADLIYIYSSYRDGRDMLDVLKEQLIKRNFVFCPPNNREILNKFISRKDDKYFTKLVKLIARFISNFKTCGYQESDFTTLCKNADSERTRVFLKIAMECYTNYQKKLAAEKAVDYQDMINESTHALRKYEAARDKLPPFRYIIVDEYQDISKQRFDLASELARVTGAKIIAVGDDWQSIYAFSGSDVSLFTRFCERMGYGSELKIVNTYRNAQEVIDIAGKFVQENSLQIRKELVSTKHIDDPVIIYTYDDTPIIAYHVQESFQSHERDSIMPFKRQAEAIEKAIAKIISYHETEFSTSSPSILLIGRFGFEGENLIKTKKFSRKENGKGIVSNLFPKIDLHFLTAHSSKGLGFDDVIIVNASSGTYGFPCRLEYDPVLKMVMHEDESIEHAEERRLFYVAMTRTKNRVYIVTPQSKPSEFVLELCEGYKNVVLKGEFKENETRLTTNWMCPQCGHPLQLKWYPDFAMKLYCCTNESEICGYLSNDLSGGSRSIQKCPKCDDGYLLIASGIAVKESFDITHTAAVVCTNYNRKNSPCNQTSRISSIKGTRPRTDYF